MSRHRNACETDSFIYNCSRGRPVHWPRELPAIHCAQITDSRFQSVLTLCILGARFYLPRLHRQAFPGNIPNTSRHLLWLETTCRRGIKCLLWLWAALSGWNLMIAVRAPICLHKPLGKLQGGLLENSWKFGYSCRIHRTIVALSVILLYDPPPKRLLESCTNIC